MSAIGDLVCLSHLRWGFVFQRPNHLMSRFARNRRTFFLEEPILGGERAELQVRQVAPNLFVAVPHLPPGSICDTASAQRMLVDRMTKRFKLRAPAVWYYTPMALSFARQLEASVTVYDCMDELTGFRGAHPALKTMEQELLDRADVVFTGGQSLYERKRLLHANVHPFPSSVEVSHFARARDGLRDPVDQAAFGRPRVGYFGVIDERVDLLAIERLAASHPRWHIVMIGPVVKIDAASLPRLPNIHYLGQKSYEELPSYVAGWDVAMMPFLLNDATRYISPTKTLEYLAAGKPVVSTAIHDVVHPYGEQGIVTIADAESFPRAVQMALAEDPRRRLAAADEVLSQTSWDRVAKRMWTLVERSARQRQGTTEAPCSTT